MMTKKISLNAQSRTEENGKPQKIRAGSFVPAVVYGFGVKNKNVKIKRLDFERVFELAGEFNLIDLKIDDQEPAKVIVKDLQRDAVKGNIIHVDFYQVDMNKKIITQIPLKFVGESKAVKELGGTLLKNMDNVEVECLPGDLVSHIDIDLSELETFEDFIRLRDLKLPSGMELSSETNEVVANITEARAKEEEERKEEEGAEATEKEAGEEAAGEKGGEEKTEKEAASEEKQD